MANRNQGPFWNQDAIMAAGLAFAGMAVLQSKLFPAASWTEWPWLRDILNSRLAEWWPLLLIVAGIALWVGRLFERHSQKGVESVALMGGQHGTGNQN
jgi:hypothetical protein